MKQYKIKFTVLSLDAGEKYKDDVIDHDEITEGEHERLLKIGAIKRHVAYDEDDDENVVLSPRPGPDGKEGDSAFVGKSDDEVKAIASDLGITVKGLKRADLEAAILAAGAGS